MPVILVNPMDETPRIRGRRAPRLAALTGKTIGLLDISKPGGKTFLDHIERRLLEGFGVARVIRETKPTFAKRAPEEVIRRLRDAGCDGVVEALAD